MSTTNVSLLIARIGVTTLATVALVREQVDEADAACYLCTQVGESYYCTPAYVGYPACRDVSQNGITMCQLSGPSCIAT